MGSVDRDEILRAQDWKALHTKVASFVRVRIGPARVEEARNAELWDRAREVAQETIVRAFQHHDGWNPEKEPLLKFLCLRALMLITVERRRHRTKLEVALTERHEERAGDPQQDPADEALHRRRTADAFRRRLLERLEEDAIGQVVVTLMMEGIDTPKAQARASGRKLPEMEKARRRVFYHGDVVEEELSKELDEAASKHEDEEVAR